MLLAIVLPMGLLPSSIFDMLLCSTPNCSPRAFCVNPSLKRSPRSATAHSGRSPQIILMASSEDMGGSSSMSKCKSRLVGSFLVSARIVTSKTLFMDSLKFWGLRNLIFLFHYTGDSPCFDNPLGIKIEKAILNSSARP